MVAVMVVNSGVALAYGAMPALIMSAVPLTETGAANGFNALMRSLGTSVGAAVVGVVLAQMTTTAGGFTFTSEAGFRTGLLMGGGFALLSGAIAALIPALRPQQLELRDQAGPTTETAPASVSKQRRRAARSAHRASSTYDARWASEEAMPASWSARSMPGGTSVAVKVTSVPTAEAARCQVIVMVPA